MKSPQLLFVLCAILLPGVVRPCAAQSTSDGYGLIAPWGTPAPDGRLVSREPPSVDAKGSLPNPHAGSSRPRAEFSRQQTGSSGTQSGSFSAQTGSSGTQSGSFGPQPGSPRNATRSGLEATLPGHQQFPVHLDDPIDPITGLPLRMTSLAGSSLAGSSLAGSSGTGSGPAIHDPTPTVPLPTDTPPAFPGTPSTHRADTARQPAGQTHRQPPPPGPLLRPDTLLPAIPAPPPNPLIPPSVIDPFQHRDLHENRHRYPDRSPHARPGGIPQRGPVQFDGSIQLPHAGEELDFGTLPEPVPLIPLPRLDPPLFDAGNRDGELDWIDLIEEYAGRATRSDLPRDPGLTPPHERSWLRLENWRVDATSDVTDSDHFGLATFYGGATIGLGKIRGITVKPSFSFHEAFGTARTRLEDQLYDVELEAAWMHQLDQRWRMRVEFGAGLYTDFDIEDEFDAIRLNGLGLFSYEWDPELQVVLGAIWLNLENREVFPIGGVIWQPNDHLQFEILFPEWKLAGLVQEQREGELWSYVGGGFFGRTWRIERDDGFEDLATFSNWRVYVGWEKRHISGMTYFAEFGYVFDRRLRFRSDVGERDPDGVVFGRAGLYF